MDMNLYLGLHGNNDINENLGNIKVDFCRVFFTSGSSVTVCFKLKRLFYIMIDIIIIKNLSDSLLALTHFMI